MRGLTIEIDFNVDVKQSLYRSAYLDAMTQATFNLETLWYDASRLSIQLIRPSYTITYTKRLA